MQLPKGLSKRFSTFFRLNNRNNRTASASSATTTTTTTPTPEMTPEEKWAAEEAFLFAAGAAEGAVRIDQVADEELVGLFNLEGPGVTRDGRYQSARYLGIQVLQVAGMAPSLHRYHILWRHRYTLEVQMPHNWASLRERFWWAGLPDSAIRTGDIDADIKIARELIVLLRLSARVLAEILASGAPDIVNTVGWIEEELAAVRGDEQKWRSWLRTMILQKGQGW